MLESASTPTLHSVCVRRWVLLWLAIVDAVFVGYLGFCAFGLLPWLGPHSDDPPDAAFATTVLILHAVFLLVVILLGTLRISVSGAGVEEAAWFWRKWIPWSEVLDVIEARKSSQIAVVSVRERIVFDSVFSNFDAARAAIQDFWRLEREKRGHG